MIWLVLALIGAGTFFVTGFNLLTDPLCVTADFGGGRVVQVTCRSDELGTVTGTQAGLISILIGLGILTLIFWRPIKVLFPRNKLIKEARNQIGEDRTDVAISNSVSELPTKSPGVTKKCPKCAEDIKSEAIKCRFCGSDLGPKGVEKTNLILGNFLKKYPPKNHVFEIMALTLVVVAALMFISIQTTESRELNALKNTGQVCVITEDGTGDYGCATYPQIQFEVCSPYEFISWSVRAQDFTFLTDDFSVSQGQKSFSCSDVKYPYLFSIDSKLEETTRVGEYDIFGSRYGSLASGDYLEGGIYSLVAKVSIKPKS